MGICVSERYRFIVYSVEQLVQQVATSYVGHGYRYWVSGRIPAGKDPVRTELRFFEKYNIGRSRREVARFRARGEAIQHYLRLEPSAPGQGTLWVILSSKGSGAFWEEERPVHLRARPLELGPYAVSYRRAQDGDHHAWVGLSALEYERFGAVALELALRRSAKRLAGWFYHSGYQPYWGVTRQLFRVLKEVNRKRKRAGLELVGKTCIPRSRTQLKVWGERPTNHAECELARELAA